MVVLRRRQRHIRNTYAPGGVAITFLFLCPQGRIFLEFKVLAYQLPDGGDTFKQYTTDRIFKKRGYERDEFLFRTVIKIRKIQFTQFLHTSASKFFLRALPRYYMLQPILDILFYIALLSNKILVLFGLDFRAGNSKFQRPKIPAHSDTLLD